MDDVVNQRRKLFTDHLDYLLNLLDEDRSTKEEWRYLRKRLKELGRWKDKPRGLADLEHFQGRSYKDKN